jgi:hypothetical protein
MAVRRTSPILLAGLAALAAALLPAARDAAAQQIVLSNTRSLAFGRFAAAGGGTVTISPTGMRSQSGGVVLLNSPGAGPASFQVDKSGDGTSNLAVAIMLPGDGSVMLSSGMNSMAVNTFVTEPATLTVVPNGGTTLSVGATLTVAPSQPRGSYSGSFPLIVNFQ